MASIAFARIDAEKNAAAYADELAELRDQSYELKALAFDLEEWAALQQEHHRLANSANLLSGLEACIALLDENEPNANAMLTQVQVKLAHLVEFDAAFKRSCGRRRFCTHSAGRNRPRAQPLFAKKRT